MFSTARWRLALWFTGVFAVLLIVIGSAVFFSTRTALFAQVNDDLNARADRIVQAGVGPAGGFERGRADVFYFATGGGYFYRIITPQNIYTAPQSANDITFPDQEEVLTRTEGGPTTMDITSPTGERLRLHLERVTDAGSRPIYVQVGRSIQPELEAMRRLAFILFGGGLVGLVLAGVSGYWLAGRALRPIQAAMDAQRVFVADASHEIRTPLTLIRANAEVLKRQKGVPDETLIDDIIRESDRLTYLVSQMLTLARSDSASVQLEAGPVYLGRLARDIARQMQLLANEKSITIDVDVAPDALAEGDELRLGELLIILIDNAIKYSDPAATVSVRVTREGKNLLLVVADNGHGIPAEALPHIFDRFYRADKARSREQGGTGLGLAIARWIVERHNGRIGIDSTVGAGTTVTVELPALSAEDFAMKEDEPDSVEPTQRPSEAEGPSL